MCGLMGMKGSIDGKTWTDLRTLRLLGTLGLLPLKTTLLWNGLLTVSTTHVCLSITISRHSEGRFPSMAFSFYLWCSVNCLCNLTYTWHGVFPSSLWNMFIFVCLSFVSEIIRLLTYWLICNKSSLWFVFWLLWYCSRVSRNFCFSSCLNSDKHNGMDLRWELNDNLHL